MQYELPCAQHLSLIFLAALFYICAHMFSVGFGISRLHLHHMGLHSYYAGFLMRSPVAWLWAVAYPAAILNSSYTKDHVVIFCCVVIMSGTAENA